MNSDDVVALDDHDCDHDGDRDEEKIENERSSIRSNASMMGSMNKEVERKVCLGDQRKQKQQPQTPMGLWADVCFVEFMVVVADVVYFVYVFN